MHTSIKKIFVLSAYLIMLFVNYLARSLPLAGRNTGEISDNYPNLLAPAGYTFSIWGIIYALLAVYLIYQFTQNKDKLLERINPIFILNALLNSAWLFAWHYNQIWLSVMIMSGLLATLVAIATILNNSVLTKKERWLVQLPFEVYFGWITIAAIANIIVLMVSLGWYRTGVTENVWTVAALLLGAFFGFRRILRDQAVAYGSVLIWAYGGILYRHLSDGGFSGKYPLVILTTVLCMLIFTGLLLKPGIMRKIMFQGHDCQGQ